MLQNTKTSVFEAKDIKYLKSLWKFEFYERPCHSLSAGITGNRFCNEDRGLIRMRFASGYYPRKDAPYTVQ